MQTPNYVAKLRVNVLRAKGLKRLGHIFHFATLPFRLQGQHFRQGLPIRPRVRRGARFASVLRAPRFHRWIPRTVPEKRGALEHRRSSSYRCSTPGALAPVRVILSRSIITYWPHPSHLQAHLDFAA